MKRAFTGRDMATILVGFFGVVIAVNLVMARYASSTFGGLVVENSYVASQEFNRWLAAAEADRALGWEVAVSRRDDGRLGLELSGAPAGTTVTGKAIHPLGRQPDARLTFVPRSEGGYVSREVLPPGRWKLRLEARGAGHVWRQDSAL